MKQRKDGKKTMHRGRKIERIEKGVRYLQILGFEV